MSIEILNIILATIIILSVSIMPEGGQKAGVARSNLTAEFCALSLLLGLWVGEFDIIAQIVIVSAVIILILGEIDKETAILMQLGIVGLIILTQAQSLMIIYLGMELIGLSFYVLAGRERKSMKSTEAGIKYFILGALSSGVFLLGITIVYAQTGSTDIELMGFTSQTLIIIGMLFKLGAAPFHMWVPDVYEGSATIITMFFAIVPKIAYLAVLMKLGNSEQYILLAAGLFSLIIGSIGAINQTKIKRLLAYSAIGHVGFLLIGVAIGTFESLQAVIIYMIIYVIMTINSFSIVLSQGFNKLVEFRGLSRRNPVLAMTMGLGLMSIAGIPPLAGFYNKYLVLMSAVSQSYIEIALIAVILSVISSFYYIRIIRFMYFIDKADIVVASPDINFRTALILGATTFAIFTIMIFPSFIFEVAIPFIY